jgi:hypothetical protein
MLAIVTKEAKRSMYSNQIANSANKIKATWNIVKAETDYIDPQLISTKILPILLTNIFYQ